jgi:DNA invertase Pin-like site-specific DNA recombinase
VGGVTRVRCAIYTRKSTEEGLEQAFNSLDAQREACAAYIASQRHENWTMLPTHYDDGGFSGGNMERPGLKQLLAEVAAGRVDVIVIYKVDRLTRSLADFAKIVDVLDGAGASFVSVTQSFNTTTSMGRLTLNMLLSFAQFEREVTGERIRDKVAASKRKGMWMGGNVPLGYEVHERKLVPNEVEAETVRLIFTRYLALGSLSDLASELDRLGIRSKRRVLSDGRVIGNRAFSLGALAHLLKNRTYVGEVSDHGELHPGEHPAIVAPDLFKAAQQRLQANRQNHRMGARATSPSLLASMLHDGEGRPMRPSHATKGSRRYRYYVTASTTADRRTPASACKVPAGELDQLVRERLAEWLGEPRSMLDLCGEDGTAGSLPALLTAAQALAQELAAMPIPQVRQLLLDLSTQVQVDADQVLISISASPLAGRLGYTVQPDPERRCIIPIPAALTRRGQELRLAFSPDDRSAPAQVDTRLVGLIAKAHAAHRTLLAAPTMSKAERGHLTRLARLATLAPDITSAILDGRQPVALSARMLLRMPDLPLAWADQRVTLGFG